MSCRRPSSRRGAAVLLAVLLPGLPALTGCARAVEGVPAAAPATGVPDSVQELGGLIVSRVPSGLPRVPDDRLDPPAGPTGIEDVAGYADQPRREQQVLAGYGYRFGWERFWSARGMHDPLTGVFVHQFEHRAGAGAYAQDLARNDAEYYAAAVRENPAGLPGGCWTLTLEDPEPGTGLGGPAAFAWCTHGVFSVQVTSVAGSLDAAVEEVRAVVDEQLELLPPR